MKDATNHKYVEEMKILKLINRMYDGERLSHDQYLKIYEYVETKGRMTVIGEKYLKYEYHIGDYVQRTKELKGKRYLGIFATTDFDERIMYFGNVCSRYIDYVKLRGDGSVYRSS